MKYPDDYVTYEQALRLKELGFNNPTIASYSKDGIFTFERFDSNSLRSYLSINNYNDEDQVYLYKEEDVDCSAPTLYEVQKWLRETKEIQIEITYNAHYKAYATNAFTNTGEIIYGLGYVCDTYEQALLATIDKTLIYLQHE